MATYGVLKRGWTDAIFLKNSPSSAIAKKIRGPVIIEPLRVPNAEIITAIDTSLTPVSPTTRKAVSAATSLEPAICLTSSKCK